MKKKNLLLTGVFTTAYVVNLMLSPISAYAGTLDNIKVTDGAQKRAAIHIDPIISPESILRLGGIDRFETAAKIAQEGWSKPVDNTSKHQTIAAILTAGTDENLVDALSAAPLAKKLDAPMLLTEGNRLNSFAESELKRLKVNTVYITSGTDVIGQPVIDALKKINKEMKIVILGGKDRFETSVNIAKEMGSIDEVVIATGASNADALSMASIAAAKGIPILLSNTEGLPDSIAQYLENKPNIKKYYLLGGEAALSSEVERVLSGETVRITGIDRYETNQNILAAFASEINDDRVYLANGDEGHLVDALTGAVLAAKTNSPVLLVGSDLSELTKDFVKLGISPVRNIVALGGNAVVGPSLVQDMASASVYEEDNVKVGSESTDSPQVINDNVYVMGNSVILENAEFKYNLYVHGNTASLKNIKVAGSIFVNPGESGILNLDNLQAKNVYVLSGATDSIYLANSKISNLIVKSSSNVRIVSTGTTDVSNTVVSSKAILESIAGTFGNIEIAKSDDNRTVVELRGTFDKPVTVTGAAEVIAATNVKISELEVAPKNKEDKVILQGRFNTVKVNNESILELGPNTRVSTIVSNASVNLVLDATARVTEITENGNMVEVSGNGADNIGDSAGNNDSSEEPDNTGDSGDTGNTGDGEEPDNTGDSGDTGNTGDGEEPDNTGDNGDICNTQCDGDTCSTAEVACNENTCTNGCSEETEPADEEEVTEQTEEEAEPADEEEVTEQTEEEAVPADEEEVTEQTEEETVPAEGEYIK